MQIAGFGPLVNPPFVLHSRYQLSLSLLFLPEPEVPVGSSVVSTLFPSRHSAVPRKYHLLDSSNISSPLRAWPLERGDSLNKIK
jgi:hypothetical protein